VESLDDKYLAAALLGRATYVVSGDHHLLDLGEYQGIRILKPRPFLELLSKA
jgi:predicted nucleic acid-binding protein